MDIVATSNEQLVPIRPICDALGIDYKVQWQKLKDDEDLSSTMVLSTTVGADRKEREMCCLPIRYIFGWLFTINPKNVKPEAQEAVRAYRRSCYDALYAHFFGSQKRQLEQNQIEITLGHRKPSRTTIEKIQKSVHDFANELSQVHFV